MPPNGIAAVLVVFYPEIILFERCLASLRLQVDKIIVVNNGVDSLGEIALGAWLASGEIDFLIPQNDNIGLAAAQNVGIFFARNLGVNYVLLVDQDSQADDNMVSRMLEVFLDSAKPVAIVAPRIYDRRSSDELSYLSLVSGRYINLPFDLLKISPKFNDKFVEVEQVLSSGMLFPITLIAEIGAMKAEFFIDGVDVEWCVRVKNRGYKILLAKEANLSHSLGDEIRRVWFFGWRNVPLHSSVRQYYFFRNFIYLIKSWRTPLGLKTFFLKILIWRVIFIIISSRSRGGDILAVVAGIRDSLMSRLGKKSQ